MREAERGRLPTWVLFVAPIVAVALSNTDVLMLARANPQAWSEQLRLALFVTLPLSALACGVTVWYMLRLGGEIDRRAATEFELRMALCQRGTAMEDLGRALDRERLLRRELDHRVRNNLTALLGLVGMYEDAQTTPADAVGALRGKIETLREVYGLISTSQGSGIALGEVIRIVLGTSAVGPGARHVFADGPPVGMTGREANALAMIMQELLTNARKHGALRGGDDSAGSIDIRWNAEKRGRQTYVSLRWVESLPGAEAGDEVFAPAAGGSCERSGIGLSLISGFADSDLRGGVSYRRGIGRWTVELGMNLSRADQYVGSPALHMEAST